MREETRVAKSSRPGGAGDMGSRQSCAGIPPPGSKPPFGALRPPPRSLRPSPAGKPLLETIGDGNPQPLPAPTNPGGLPANPGSPAISWQSPEGGLGCGGRPLPPAPQGRFALCTAGITFHPVHYLTRRPFAHGFHDQSHGTGTIPRGAQSSTQTNSAARAARRWGPLLAAASQGGRRGEGGFCVSGLAAAMPLRKRRAAAVGAAAGWETRWGRGSAPIRLGPVEAAAAAVAPPLRSGLRPSGASVQGTHC